MKSMLGGLATAVSNLTPIPYVGKRGTGQAPALPFTGKMGMTAQLEAYGAVGILFAIVSRTSTAVAQVPWRLYRKAPSGNPEDRTEVTGHVALDLWNHPNPWMPRQEFVETFQQHIELTGETEWVVGRNKTFSTMPLELWPVRPDRMEPVPHPTEFLTGWTYKGPDGEKVPLDVDDVIQVRMPNPMDPYRGLGPVQAMLTDLDSERYSAEWNRNFFINGAEPGGLIEVPDVLSDTEFDQLRSRWNAQHRGVANAHRVAILEHGKWVDRRFSMRDLQFVELRKVSGELVRKSFGFPKPLLGDSDDVNRAAAEAAEVMFARWLVVPRLERIKGVLNNDLLRLFGSEDAYEFDYDNPVPENAEQEIADRDSRVAAAVALIGQGFDRGQVLEAFELPELTWTEPPPPPALAPVPAPPAEAARLALPPAPDPHAHHRHVTARPRPPGPRAEDQDDQLQAVQGDWEAALAAVLAQWGAVVGQWRVDLAAQISAAVEDDDTAALANLSLDTADGEQLLQSAMADMADVAASRMAAEAASQGVNVDSGNANLDSLNGYATATVALLAGSLAAAAGREAIRVRGPGTTGDEVAGLVSEFLASLSDRPLQDMLGGALSNAQNAGRIATLRLAPEAAYYANETLDSNTCRYCQEVDGRWLGNSLDEVERTYPNGGYVACAGRERCRGTVTAVWRPEQVGDG